jgi:hypothetical protein
MVTKFVTHSTNGNVLIDNFFVLNFVLVFKILSFQTPSEG